ncbi:hypothetical protein W97_02441 [Coniosporium apollinis CBS 100218]|uniref:Major facilitator superfamily (MFS) profile domain-containing protein n=1 Tax=Coniosporium apollinis (strain CBS 100218) TaxID=1168221 RepID=R7YN31_CONA1|nr:uncharacterized protein W97_02441 [Coniosporium apollinis CBS 100218]EON63214.1 hypothetical protein W97_02441 [Coniosporium apollinis CBS 100218]
MGGFFGTAAESWRMFSGVEKRNIMIYIGGIMLYKFGLEAFNGSIVALATNRYDNEAKLTGTTARTFERVGLLVGLNQAFQCVGSILIAPLIKRFQTKMVLASAIFVFAIFTALLMIIDAATGGTLKPKGAKSSDWSYYGTYNTDGMIPIYCLTGIAYGMVELIRRVIPRDIVGGNVQKLRRMDALVHIFYEIAGTSGAFCTALGLIPYFGNNFSFIITPICFTCAAGVWFLISRLGTPISAEEERSRLARTEKPNYVKSISASIFLFFQSIWTGGKIIFTSRRYIWLLPGYTFALYGHRYVENGVSPAIARRYLGNSAWSQIMVGGSNFGELLGALFVFLFTNLVTTPMPWLRLDALLLLIPWFLSSWYPPRNDVNQAWIVAGAFIPVSFGWAAGDVSLAAYIQASLARKEAETKNVSALGAVMAFLYSTYIVIYAIASPLLGRYIDRVSAANGGDIHDAIRNVAGVQFTVISVCVLLASLVPKGAIAFNPKMLDGQSLDSDIGQTYEKDRESSDIELKDEKAVMQPAVKPGDGPL